jgi:glycerophosphoryl diester phosphodiesterase
MSTARKFDLQGHRGARGLLPENTLPSFAKVLSIGVNTIELDVGITKDLQVIVFHNPHLEPEIVRTPDGQWLSSAGPAVYSLTLEEIKTYDVGRLNPATSYAKEYPDQRAVDGATVPTLGEVFELVIASGNTDVEFNIEFKISPKKPDLSPPPAAFASTVLDVVNAYEMGPRTTIQSFDWRTVQEIQNQAPEIRTSYLTASQSWFDTVQAEQPGPSPWLSGFDIDQYGGSIPHAVKAAGGAIWSSYYSEVTPETVAAAHELGLMVKVWTVNKPADMNRLIDMGVDGIITDYPDVLRKIMVERNMLLPTPTPNKP